LVGDPCLSQLAGRVEEIQRDEFTARTAAVLLESIGEQRHTADRRQVRGALSPIQLIPIGVALCPPLPATLPACGRLGRASHVMAILAAMSRR
jgi:hypothetical protein